MLKIRTLIFYPDKIVRFCTIPAGMQRLPILQRSIIMKTLITALAVTAILATSAVGKTARTKETHAQHNNLLSHNSASHNAVTRNPTQINSSCRFEHGETDPDTRIVLQLHRDCREHEMEHVE
jgi:hypothetical protein